MIFYLRLNLLRVDILNVFEDFQKSEMSREVTQKTIEYDCNSTSERKKRCQRERKFFC